MGRLAEPAASAAAPSSLQPYEFLPNFVDAEPRDYPVEIRSIEYGILSADAIHRLSVLPCRRVIGPVREYGVNDTRLGVCDRASLCATCQKRSVDCVGHAGHVDLEAPVFHIGYFPAIIRILRTICKGCAHVLLAKEEVEFYSRRLQRAAALEPLQHLALVKQIQVDAYKTRVCLTCGGLNGTVRRVRPMRLVHEKYRTELRRGEVTAEDTDAFFQVELSAAVRHQPSIGDYVENIHDFLDPFRVYQLFRAIPAEQHLLLGLQGGARPEDLLVRALVVPPIGVRPSGGATLGGATREDDLTIQYNDILCTSDALQEGTNDAARYAENWELLQTRVARLFDAAMPGFPAHAHATDCKSYAQRLKGKHGRFRGNLSGKRVDFSGRSVISPDPNLGIDEIAVPLRVARVLTYPQRVFAHNLEQLRRLVRNGPHVHPGAMTVFLAREASRKSLFVTREREVLAARLAVGDVVERHVINGDLILFNRQPSLHRLSMMAHRARVLPFRTFRFNECCCTPYNADFDGDEMNVHVVQTEEARAEAQELMLASQNIISPKNGEPIIACTQDFLTGAYLLTARDVFFDRAQFTQLVSHWLGAHTRFELPIPALLKPAELWTGKQLLQLLLRPSPQVHVLLNLEAKTRFCTNGAEKHRDPAEGFVAFLDSVLIAGRLDKKLLGSGAKDGLFARLYALTGGPYTATCMSHFAQLTSRYLQNYGFSLGLGDVSPTPSLTARKAAVLSRSLARCDALIKRAATGHLVPLPGMSVKESLEAGLNAELSKVRDECGTAAVEALDALSNAPLIMVHAGSKGSALNTAQMMACVGQQTVNGKRIMNAFQDRSLPHFLRHAEDPAARGFVANSFYTGLEPTEFFFHTMAGREGLVDTAVKTAETGYIYRRLSKAMESLSVQYDYTVRNARGAIVQLRYGDDGMDPWQMEGSDGTPLNLQQEWLAARAAYARFLHARVSECSRLECLLRQAEQQPALATGDGAAAVEAARVLLASSSGGARGAWAGTAGPPSLFYSLLPDEVVPYVERLVSGAADLVAERIACETAELQERQAVSECIARLEVFLARCRGDMSAGSGGRTCDASASASTSTSGNGGGQLRAHAVKRLARIRSVRFSADVCRFFEAKAQEQRKLRERLGLPLDERTTAAAAANGGTSCSDGDGPCASANGQSRKRRSRSPEVSLAPAVLMESLQTELLPLTEGMIALFLGECARKYLSKTCEPGTPCGTLAAQSVGEPSTQMTLRTFHFAGVASMNITQGVPRLVEIINANKNIATPIVRAPILGPREWAQTLRALRGMVERVVLREVCTAIVEVVTPRVHCLQICLNMPLIERLLLPIDAVVVRQRLLREAARPMSKLRHLREDCVVVLSRDALRVYPFEADPARMHFNLQFLLALLPDVVVSGVTGVNRVMISKDGGELLAEGAELRAVMALPGVDGTRTVCNHVAVVERTLGIEAARQAIVNEINEILKAYSLSIDIRHVYLLADVMTSRGVVLGITRYGIQKMDYNVLTMASFERTTEHLYNAAVTQREDKKLSVSENIIIGKPIPIGTGAFSLLMASGSGEDGVGARGAAARPDSFLMSAYRRYGALSQFTRSAAGHTGQRDRLPLAAAGVFRVGLFD